MQKFDVVVVGELNIDLILDQIQTLPELGKEILCDRMELVLGSSSAILASNLSSLGLNVAFIGKIGKDDFGDYVLHCLNEKNICTDYIVQDKNVKTGATVILNYPEDRAMVTHKGAMDALTLRDIQPEVIQKARHLHFSSYYLQDGIHDDCPSLFQMARELGLTTSFDTNWDPAERWGAEIFNVLPFVDVFLPNKDEALLISGRNSVEEALDRFSQFSRIVAVKLGKEGAVVKHDGQTTKVPAFDVKAVDAVGAGDSFNSGFLFNFLRDEEIPDCAKLGNACGALSVTKAGGTAAFQSPEQIEHDFETMLSFKVSLAR